RSSSGVYCVSLHDALPISAPPSLFASVVFPHVDVPTRDARQMIRTKVALKDAVTQWGNIAGLVAGLYSNDYQLIGRSMHDVLIRSEEHTSELQSRENLVCR